MNKFSQKEVEKSCLQRELRNLDDELSFEATDDSWPGKLWNTLNKWYEGKKEGWHFSVNKDSKNKWWGWFSYRKRF